MSASKQLTQGFAFGLTKNISRQSDKIGKSLIWITGYHWGIDVGLKRRGVALI